MKVKETTDIEDIEDIKEIKEINDMKDILCEAQGDEADEGLLNLSVNLLLSINV